jgi:hypothetical protein
MIMCCVARCQYATSLSRKRTDRTWPEAALEGTTDVTEGLLMNLLSFSPSLLSCASTTASSSAPPMCTSCTTCSKGEELVGPGKVMGELLHLAQASSPSTCQLRVYLHCEVMLHGCYCAGAPAGCSSPIWRWNLTHWPGPPMAALGETPIFSPAYTYITVDTVCCYATWCGLLSGTTNISETIADSMFSQV